MLEILKQIFKLNKKALPDEGIAVDVTSGDFSLPNNKPFTMQSRAEGNINVSYKGRKTVVPVYGLAGQYHPQVITTIRTSSTVKLFTIFPA